MTAHPLERLGEALLAAVESLSKFSETRGVSYPEVVFALDRLVYATRIVDQLEQREPRS